MLHEYLASTLGRIQVPAYLEKLNNMVVAGSEIELIAKLCAAPLEKEGIPSTLKSWKRFTTRFV